MMIFPGYFYCFSRVVPTTSTAEKAGNMLKLRLELNHCKEELREQQTLVEVYKLRTLEAHPKVAEKNEPAGRSAYNCSDTLYII